MTVSYKNKKTTTIIVIIKNNTNAGNLCKAVFYNSHESLVYMNNLLQSWIRSGILVIAIYFWGNTLKLGAHLNINDMKYYLAKSDNTKSGLQKNIIFFFLKSAI